MPRSTKVSVLAQSSVGLVKLYVTYSLSGKEHKTHGVDMSRKPYWGYEKCVKLHIDSIRSSKVSYSYDIIKFHVIIHLQT